MWHARGFSVRLLLCVCPAFASRYCLAFELFLPRILLHVAFHGKLLVGCVETQNRTAVQYSIT